MLKQVTFSKKPQFILTLEKNGGTDYKVYEDGPLTILYGIEPKGKRKKMIKHITVNSKNRYSASREELEAIAKELMKDTPYKIRKSFFMRSVAHIFEI